MNSDNAPQTTRPVPDGQTGPPQPGTTFIPYQAEQTRQRAPLRLGRGARAGVGLRFIQYQPPQSIPTSETRADATTATRSAGSPASPPVGNPNANANAPDYLANVTGSQETIPPLAPHVSPLLSLTPPTSNPELVVEGITTLPAVPPPPQSVEHEDVTPTPEISPPPHSEEHGVVAPAPEISSTTSAPTNTQGTLTCTSTTAVEAHTNDPTTTPGTRIDALTISSANIINTASTGPEEPEKLTNASTAPTDVPEATLDVTAITQDSLRVSTPTSSLPSINPTPTTPSNIIPAENAIRSVQAEDPDTGALAVNSPSETGETQSHEGEDDSGGEFLDEHSSHHLRNPDRPIIPPSTRPKHTRGKKYTASVAREVRKAKDALLDTDLEAVLGKLEVDIKMLAEKHSRSEDSIKQLVTQHTNYKNTKKVNIFNALVHQTALEVNGDRPPGDRLPLQEVQKIALENRKDLTEEDERKLIEKLTTHRDTMRNGVRCNNIAANQDFQSTVERIGSEFTALTNRTNCVAMAFFAPGHINDTVFPCWIHSGDTAEFVTDELKMSSGELARKLGLWATSQKTKSKPVNKLVSLQKESSKIIVEGLRNITGRQDLKMSYEKYKRDVQLAHKVRLKAWPLKGVVQSPYHITSISDVRLLHEALKAGECRWVDMTSTECDDLKRELKGQAPKSRKQGKGKRKRSENIENEGPGDEAPTRKKARRGRKTAQTTSKPQSQPEISSDDDTD